jgi:hypothetical protein
VVGAVITAIMLGRDRKVAACRRVAKAGGIPGRRGGRITNPKVIENMYRREIALLRRLKIGIVCFKMVPGVIHVDLRSHFDEYAFLTIIEPK